MKYPWIFLTVLAIWLSTFAIMVLNSDSLDPNMLFLFGTVCVLAVFLIGYKSR